MKPAIWILAAAFAAPHAVADTDATLETGRSFTRHFYAGEVGRVWEAFSDEMRTALGSEGALARFQEQVSAQLGQETAVLDEAVSEAVPGVVEYVRLASFERTATPIQIYIAFQGDRIAGFRIAPQTRAAPSEHESYQTRAHLRLPFDGAWYVGWGGRTIEQNYHAAVPDQRYAYDFLVVRNGRTFDGDGRSLENYHCFGRPILAPGAGIVAAAVDGMVDHPPGTLVPADGPGNHVVIDHGNDEFSFLAHLRESTVTVEQGQRVDVGTRIGECGNSGHSSEPHLHYHLQTDATFHGGRGGTGLPAQFNRYRADGRVVERGEPVRAQTIEAID